MKNLSFLILLISQLSIAQNHLEPTNSFFDVYDYQYTYYSKVRETLLKSLNDKPILRMIVFPSFRKEYIIQIEKDIIDESKFFIIINEPVDYSVWEHNRGNTSEMIESKTYKSDIEKEDAEALQALFYSAIVKSKFKADDILRGDGTTYLLSVWNDGLKSTETWSPRNPNLKELIFLMENLVEAAKSERKITFSNKFKKSVINLTEKFNKKLILEEIEFLLKFNQSVLEVEKLYSESEDYDDISNELYELFEEVKNLVETQGIYYSLIEDIILEYERFSNDDWGFESKSESAKDNPFLKLMKIYKSDLK